MPGSRGLHGITVIRGVAWVAGTDADVVTLVDLDNWEVVGTFPVRGPTAVRSCVNCTPDLVFIASSPDSSIYAVDPHTLQTTRIIRDIPSPQDFILSPFIATIGPVIATTGPGNSIASITGETVTLIPGFPGAAGVAGFQGSAAPSGLPGFTLVTSPDSNSLFFLQPPPPIPSEFSISNAASFATIGVASGSLTSLFAATGVTQNFFADSLPLPVTLGGILLRVGGSLEFNETSGWVYSPMGAVEAPLLFVGPNQINFQIPPTVGPEDSIPGQLVRGDGSTMLTTFQIEAAAPGIFTLAMNGLGQAAVLNQDNSLNFGTNPAARGSVIHIFATGGGDPDPPLLAGEPAPPDGNPLVFTQVQPTVMIGSIEARVLFSGMAPGWVGLWQINAEVPPDVTPGPTVPLTVTADGVASNTVTIAVN